jgi:hypothetical protein
VGQLVEGSVEADRRARVVVDGGVDEAVADEAENNHLCEVPEDTDRGEPALDLAAHRSGKILRSKMADGEQWRMPGTIEDASVLDDFKKTLSDMGRKPSDAAPK